MRKRNHVIPVRLNTKELRFLSGQDPVNIIPNF